MLYTVRPLEAIYAIPVHLNRSEKDKKQEDFEGQFREIPLPSGRIVARREGENYIVERINSTDMQDYLKDDFAPGKNIKE